MLATKKSTARYAAIDWQRHKLVPAACAAALDAFKFTSVAQTNPLSLSETGWKQALDFCDESQLTLLLAERRGERLPGWVAERIAANRRSNTKRLQKLEAEYRAIAARLAAESVEHVVLKGFAQQPLFVPDAFLRPQYDLDLWCRQEQVETARRALMELGFESLRGHERFPTDHLPPMTRKTGWQWRGDYFDPEIPPVVELHFRLWDEQTEGFAAPGLDGFWERRRRQPFGNDTLPALHEADQFGYASLHVLRHLLRGNLKALHVWEIAYFLERHQTAEAFWEEWHRLHSPELRALQSLACCLAIRWFGCGAPERIAREIGGLSPEARAWFDLHAACPIESRFVSSKDELWLHLVLLPSFAKRLAVLRRRLIPTTLPGPVDSVYVPESRRSLIQRVRSAARYGAHLAGRLKFHASATANLVRSGCAWWWKLRKLRGGAGLRPAQES